jgi:uncharacterized membrane protein
MDAPFSLLGAAITALAVTFGLMAGFFFAFSVLVMRALAALPPSPAIAAMQSINRVVINPWFLTPFLGAAAGSAAVAVAALLRWDEPGTGLVVAGCALYALGTFGVTLVFNVPRNQALDVLPAESAEAAELWKTYVVEWTAWNHVRTIAALLAAALLTLAR